METRHSYGFLVISSAGIILNTLQITMILRERDRRHPFKISILSLAIADLLICLGCAVFSSFNLVGDPELQPYLSFIYVTVAPVSVTCSSLHLIFITLQRLIAVRFPLSCSRIMTTKRCVLVLLMIWAISTTPIPFPGKLKYLMGAATLICGVVLAVAYSFIGYLLTKRGNIASSAAQSSQNTYVLAYAITLTSVFIFCTFPLSFEIITKIGKRNTSNSNRGVVAMTFLYWLNPLMDPIVYVLLKFFKRGINKCSRKQGRMVAFSENDRKFKCQSSEGVTICSKV
ncbi:melanocortin receptor 5-like [Rhopilema esculentum]|uniref:melanocortin receptor 5-like n=1 Tax=Rhopilema esculentum TaxID=499914 RepID=UPI0031D80CD4|eukprot:gene8372-14345_t